MTLNCNVEAQVKEIWEERSTLSLPLLPDLLYPGEVAPFRVSSMGQIYRFENY